MSLGDVQARDKTAYLRALAHPIRLRILSLLTGAERSAAEVGRELRITHANASYHLRQLHAIGMIEVAGEEQIRGGVAKRYRYPAERDARPAHPAGPPVPAEEYRLLDAAMAAELTRRGALRMAAPGVALATDAEFWVDPQDWADVRDRIAAAAADLHRAARPPRSPGAIRVSATLSMFRMEPDG